MRVASRSARAMHFHRSNQKEFPMKSIALITALIAGVPAVASAAPAVRVADRDDSQRTYVRERAYDNDRPYSRDHYERYDNSRWNRDFRGRWVTLARAFSARSDRQFINIGGNGRFRRLRVEGVRGQPLVTKIAIEFSDRTTQVVDLDARLPAGAGEVIDLNGNERRIHRIIVYTDPGSRGSYSIYGA
jgi:hypothetical protein